MAKNKKITASQENEIVTKSFLKKTLEKALDKNAKKIHKAIYYDVVGYIVDNCATKKEMQGLKNDILEFKDEILGEILKLREDNAIIIHQRQRIDDHEDRIEKLETRIYAAA